MPDVPEQGRRPRRRWAVGVGDVAEENVENLRQALAAFDRGDRAAYLALCDQDYEVVPVGDWPEAGATHGREAAWDFYVNVAEAFEPFDSGDAEFIDAGADKVVVRRGGDVRGRASGADVGLNYWIVVTFCEGKVLRDQWFTDRAEALEAAGLRE
jgi:ketosteroid isomerase-like protein